MRAQRLAEGYIITLTVEYALYFDPKSSMTYSFVYCHASSLHLGSCLACTVNARSASPRLAVLYESAADDWLRLFKILTESKGSVFSIQYSLLSAFLHLLPKYVELFLNQQIDCKDR
jgi:hypothetical protein